MFIRVVPYDPFWEVEYENESQKIKNILKDILVEVYHIGSTAVKGLAAKSIIDIMPVVTNISLVDKHNKEFVAIGYECMGEFGIEGRRYFRKGGDNRTHQIHIFEQSNHKDINRHIAVRDFLRTHPDIALEYGELKMELAYRFSEDIEGYCTGKDAFQMKENKYDDDIFFQKYSQMSRSQQGLAGAGEWETLRKLLPDFKDKRVLDLGCGYGWHCIYAMEHGASSVVGVDISHKMLEVAKEKTHFPQVEYKCCAIEDVEFPEESFDVILSSLAFHYVADYEILVKKIYRILKSGGKLVFTVEHPVFTAYGTQDWYYNEKGEILHFPVDNYYYEGKRTAVFLGEKVTKFHRTLTTYLNTLLSNGFIINHIVEPQPPENMMDIPGMQDEMRRPMMLIVSANKKMDR